MIIIILYYFVLFVLFCIICIILYYFVLFVLFCIIILFCCPYCVGMLKLCWRENMRIIIEKNLFELFSCIGSSDGECGENLIWCAVKHGKSLCVVRFCGSGVLSVVEFRVNMCWVRMMRNIVFILLPYYHHIFIITISSHHHYHIIITS